MSQFRKKPVVIEAVTFDEFVAYGLTQTDNVHGGMPWSFQYAGHGITHENDDCYLIPTLEGTMRFERGDMLITGVKGEIYPCKMDIFEATYDRVGGPLIAHESHVMVDSPELGGQICKNCGTPPGVKNGWSPCKHAGGAE